MLSLLVSALCAGREVTTLTDGWSVKPYDRFMKSTPFEPVTVPHTWNTEYRFLNGEPFHLRGTYVYRRNIEKTPAMQGKRIFLYFEGANSAADVFINYKHVGDHLGGYLAFCLEITDALLDGDNMLEVWVSNAHRTDVLPIMGDFNVAGGLHRPVHLIVTEQDCINPLFHASPGVFIRQDVISRAKAAFTVSTLLSLKGGKAGLKVRSTVYDAAGNVVASAEKPASGDKVDIAFSIDKPHLWHGRKDPYLYTVKSELLAEGSVVDCVEQKTGFRTIGADPDKGFLLNGEVYDLRGFCRHEDMEGKASALSMEDYERDIAIAEECGATGWRLVHYPHAEPMYDLSDSHGFIVMTEIPMCGPGGYQFAGAIQSKGFEQNARQCAEELVYQKFNHPSVCFWGIFNEVLAHNGKGRYGYDDPEAFASRINDLYHSLDTSRPTTLANAVDLPLFLHCADIIGINFYYAWYWDSEETVGEHFDKEKATAAGKPVGITEYGGGASINHHQYPVNKNLDPGGYFHPEEKQSECHELNWEQLSVRPYLWSKFIWVFADFPSQIRREGEKDGYNDKGLVTRDRSVKKDAFYLYKAQWNPEPMVYITSRRFTDRSDASAVIKVYTNQGKVNFYLNGEKVGTAAPDRIGRASVAVTLKPGANTVRVEALKGRKVIASDTCTWNLK